MNRVPVIVVGAGPTGLTLACELRLAGVPVTVLEAHDGLGEHSRAGGLQPRTVELLDQRGFAAPFLDRARTLAGAHFSGLRLDYRPLPTRHNRLFVIPQNVVEELLLDRARALGARVRFGRSVTGLTVTEDGVTVTTDDGDLTAEYLVGCDGARSRVRRAAGIDYPGSGPTLASVLGDVRLTDPPDGPVFQRRVAGLDYSVLRFAGEHHRVMVTRYRPADDRSAPVTLDELRDLTIRAAGTDFGMHDPRWLSRFDDTTRQAERYRSGRLLLAGDAAHIHYPAGGQGLNLGMQDAVNLGWKLAAVVTGRADDTLLDSYHAERHPVAARVLHNTRAQTALNRPGTDTEALRDIVGGLITEVPAASERLSAMISGLDVRYPAPDGSPLVGHRVPDADLTGGAGRIFALLRHADGVLLDLAGALDPDVLADRVGVRSVRAGSRDPRWRFPVLGELPAPAALLLRPDGHIAWAAGEPGDTDGLTAALDTWFGPATRS